MSIVDWGNGFVIFFLQRLIYQTVVVIVHVESTLADVALIRLVTNVAVLWTLQTLSIIHVVIGGTEETVTVDELLHFTILINK